MQWHIADVLRNVEQGYGDSCFHSSLRLIALIHDTFKYQVNSALPKTSDNHHGHYARRFAARYLDDPVVLDIIEWHDEAFNAWQKGARDGRWDKAAARAKTLINRLGPAIQLYVTFFRCDNATGDKTPEPVIWFENLLAAENPAEDS